MTWIGRLLQGDLGRSIRSHQPVIDNVGRRIRPSLELAVFAMSISLVRRGPGGHPLRDAPQLGGRRLRHDVRAVRHLHAEFPDRAAADLRVRRDAALAADLRALPIRSTIRWTAIRSLTLPAITLGLALAAVITRTLRSSLLETLSEDYVRTARAKGLADGAVIRRHALKNALIPVVTVLGLQFGTLIGGAVITEYIFALPGVGRLVVDAVFARDYPLVQGVVLLIAVGFILSNLVVDILYGWLDPADPVRTERRIGVAPAVRPRARRRAPEPAGSCASCERRWLSGGGR